MSREIEREREHPTRERKPGSAGTRDPWCFADCEPGQLGWCASHRPLGAFVPLKILSLSLYFLQGPQLFLLLPFLFESILELCFPCRPQHTYMYMYMYHAWFAPPFKGHGAIDRWLHRLTSTFYK